MLDVPCIIWDSNNLSQVGYVGADVTDILAAVYRECDEDLELAEHAIVVLDEIDKLARKSGADASEYKDVTGESVQQSLLKILEGSEVEVPIAMKKTSAQETIVMDTSNMLFVLNGSFEGLERIIKARMHKKQIGFFSNEKEKKDIDYLRYTTTQDLIDFGMIPEIVGRAPSIVVLNQLKEEDLVKILTEPKNAIIKQYQEMFKLDKVKLKFMQDVIKYIAHIAIEKKTNARGLRAIVDTMLSSLMFEIPDRKDIKEVVITSKLAQGMRLN
jgi:ATP-dependent Clp protease ATP-binding subunit ClpX